MSEYPQAMIKIGNATIWRNRPFAQWHQPFAPFGLIGNCVDANCPFPKHFGEETYYDPAASTALDELRPGQQLLLLTNRYGDHVNYSTLDRLITTGEREKRLFFKEPSKEFNYFKPDPAGPDSWRAVWDEVSFVALLGSDKPAFGKRGGEKLFQRTIAEMTSKNLCTVQQEFKRLDEIDNPADRPLKLRMAGSVGKLLDEAITKQDTDGLNNLFRVATGYPFAGELPIALVVLAAQGKLVELPALNPNYTDPNVQSLIPGIQHMVTTLIKGKPNALAQINNIATELNETFKFHPPISADLTDQVSAG